MNVGKKTFLKEDPDSIHYNDIEYDWEGPATVGFFSVIDSDFFGRAFVVAADPKKLKIFLDDPEAEAVYKENNAGDLKWHTARFVHHHLIEPLHDGGVIESDDRFDPQVPISGRIWEDEENPGYYLCSFWQNNDAVKKYKTQISNAFTLLNVNIHNTVFEFIGNTGKFFSYGDSFGTQKPAIKSELSAEQIKALLKIQHLSPAAKKALLSAYPANKLQLAADKLGITLAQLRHILSGPELVGKKFEESIGLDAFLDNEKLSYSDYYSPSIPYEQKPPNSFTPME